MQLDALLAEGGLERVIRDVVVKTLPNNFGVENFTLLRNTRNRIIKRLQLRTNISDVKPHARSCAFENIRNPNDKHKDLIDRDSGGLESCTVTIPPSVSFSASSTNATATIPAVPIESSNNANVDEQSPHRWICLAANGAHG